MGAAQTHRLFSGSRRQPARTRYVYTRCPFSFDSKISRPGSDDIMYSWSGCGGGGSGNVPLAAAADAGLAATTAVDDFLAAGLAGAAFFAAGAFAAAFLAGALALAATFLATIFSATFCADGRGEAARARDAAARQVSRETALPRTIASSLRSAGRIFSNRAHLG